MFRQAIKLRYLQNSNINAVLFKSINLNSNIYLNVSPSCLVNNIHTTNITYNYKHATKETQNKQEISNLSEKQFLVKVKNDPDTFGCAVDREAELTSDDEKEEKFISEKPLGRKLSTKQYADIIKAFIRKRKIKEAIDVLEVKMLKEDRVKPESYIYSLLLGACGRVGYTKKAFSLYNDMKKRALKVHPGAYTALFTACSNSPWPTTDGLTRARHLRTIMIEKMYEPNITNYNAMIKAFGRCGDLETAFALVDEMSAKKLTIGDDTINFLLQACISDKEAGFRHALLVWRKFIEKNITPSLYSYNLMLRCIRECGLGDLEVTTDVINRLVSKNEQQLLLTESEQKLISNENPTELINIKNNETNLEISNKPNLMAKIPNLGNILSLSEVTKPEDRLLLVGGFKEFLQNMADNECTPDIKTFTQFLDNIPSTLVAEKDLLQALRKINVKPDIDFFNMLIKKRSMRFDYESAKEVLKMIKTARLRPNLITYGVLALGCQTQNEAVSFLEEMNATNHRINIEILGAMLTQACYHNNFPYVIHLMDVCTTEQIQPSKKFVEKLKEFSKKSRKISNDKDNPLSKIPAYQKGHKVFKEKYKTWLQEIKIEDEENSHPWQQYRQETKTDVNYYKEKEAKSRFKPVHASLFKQKTSLKHKDTTTKYGKVKKNNIKNVEVKNKLNAEF